MKKSLLKIIGLPLVLALLAGLLITVTPASGLAIVSVVINPTTISASAGYVITISGSLNLVNEDTITVTFPGGTTFLPGFLTDPANLAFDAGGASDTPQPVTIDTQLTSLDAGIITFRPGLSVSNPDYEAVAGNLWTMYFGITAGTYGTTNDPTGDIKNPDTPGNYTYSVYTSKEPTLVFSTLPPPRIFGVSPASGPTTGGTEVTIIGMNFMDGAEVTVGGNIAVIVSSGSALTSINIITPPGEAGARDVTIVNPDGQSDTQKKAFTYIMPVTTETTSSTTTPVHTQTSTPTTTTSTTTPPVPPSTVTTTPTATATPSSTTSQPTTLTPTSTTTTSSVPAPVSTDWKVVGGSIAGGIVIVGLLVYFLWWRRHHR